MHTLHIKNMVCNRCILVVRGELERLGLNAEKIVLGEVSLDRELSVEERGKLGGALTDLGFELIDDRKSKIVEKIKNVIIDLVHYHEGEMKARLSQLLSDELNHDYTYLSNLFSDMEDVTIEKYFIAQKIERAKELLTYDELSLSEIAYRLNYSSVAYLSNQFKKVTGLTPSQFRHQKEGKRKPLDKV